MRYVLVLQWSGTTEADFDALIEMEDALSSRFGEAGIVDGHDFGADEMNIFVETDDPLHAFATAKEILGGVPAWSSVRAASRELSGETFTVLWPAGLTDFTVS